MMNSSSKSDPLTTPTDASNGKIAVVESVRVSATVDPSIKFTIEGVLSGTTTCGIATSAQTNSDSVPFGVLALDTSKVLAQKLTVSTNGAGGCVVTASESGQMSNGQVTPIFIPNTLCDSGSCTYNGAGSAWATALAHPGFGYAMDIAAGTPTVTPSTNTLYRPFSTIPNPAQTIMSNASIASGQSAYVCYKISVDATQAAGDYENQITYTATASF